MGDVPNNVEPAIIDVMINNVEPAVIIDPNFASKKRYGGFANVKDDQYFDFAKLNFSPCLVQGNNNVSGPSSGSLCPSPGPLSLAPSGSHLAMFNIYERTLREMSSLDRWS
ncbi:hypothetical protein HAX54_029910 [Datura stramonium]|uniref:Uncharacterized protein n=1 Tax=Datura stramonium TaxID=4076 RepID=A0ABS8V7N8_DATST|nr:hypothetical protein [Datura stramonium]